jgi:hypothetical protein
MWIPKEDILPEETSCLSEHIKWSEADVNNLAIGNKVNNEL